MDQAHIHQVACDTCSCDPGDPGLWYYEDRGGWCLCPCSCHEKDLDERLLLLELDYDLAHREVDPERIAQIEEVQWELEGPKDYQQPCKYCKGSLDFEPFMTLRKLMPTEIHSRMSFGVKYDEKGRPYHEFVWQCIQSHREQEATKSLCSSL